MARVTKAEPKKTLLEMTEVDEVLLEKMRQIYAEYTGIQIAAVIARIRGEIMAEEEIQKRKQLLAELGITG
jgi:hypothetical protein